MTPNAEKLARWRQNAERFREFRLAVALATGAPARVIDAIHQGSEAKYEALLTPAEDRILAAVFGVEIDELPPPSRPASGTDPNPNAGERRE